MEKKLPAIPPKRYFTIGEVSELCGVKPYVLRYWEQEFTQLRPMKRRGNRRYYQHHEVLLVRRIRDLLYDQGFTISGARNRLGGAEALAASVAGNGARGHPARGTDGVDRSHAEDGAVGINIAPADSSTYAAHAVLRADRQAGARHAAGAKSPPAASPRSRLAPVLDADDIRAELWAIRDLMDP